MQNKLFLSQRILFVLVLIGGFIATLGLFVSMAVSPVEERVLINAARVFDGYQVRENYSVLVENGVVVQVAEKGSIDANNARVLELGDSTVIAVKGNSQIDNASLQYPAFVMSAGVIAVDRNSL